MDYMSIKMCLMGLKYAAPQSPLPVCSPEGDFL